MSRRRVRRGTDALRVQALQRYEREKARNCMAQAGRFPYVLILDHLKPGYNVAKIFRSALAMGASGVHLVNIGPFDPAPAKGALRKVPAHWHDDFQQVRERLAEQDYRWFAFSPDAETALYETVLPTRSAFVFGHEEHGLTFSPQHHDDIQAIRIPQAGAVQCLNVSVAASIVMYEYLRQHRTPDNY